MSELIIHDELAERLQSIARYENRSVEEVISSLLALYLEHPGLSPADSLAALDGMFDDDITDLSTTSREVMADYYRKKYGSPD